MVSCLPAHVIGYNGFGLCLVIVGEYVLPGRRTRSWSGFLPVEHRSGSSLGRVLDWIEIR